MWNLPTIKRLAQMPKLYETEETPLEDKLIYLHFFLGGCDWYIAEWDRDSLFWGFACLNGDLHNAEWGYISFTELKNLNVGPLEVDCKKEEFWKIKPAKDVPLISKAMKWDKEADNDKRSAEEIRAMQEFEGSPASTKGTQI